MAWFEQSGQVRLVNNVTESCCAGSIHNDVPVYPRWPNDVGEKYLPDCDGDEGVSQPRAREVPAGEFSRRVKSCTVDGCRRGFPPSSMESANVATSEAVENSPACPATPPIMLAFSSCTSPWMIRLRKVLSSAVGTLRSRIEGGWLKAVFVIFSGAKISRRQNASSASPAVLFKATPKRIKPMSLYSAWIMLQRNGEGVAQ